MGQITYPRGAGLVAFHTKGGRSRVVIEVFVSEERLGTLGGYQWLRDVRGRGEEYVGR